MASCFNISKLILFAFAVLYALVHGQGAPPSIGGFGGSCFIPTHIYDEPFLGIYCNNRNVIEYGYNWTWIDLGLCVGNAEGQLFGTNVGHYTDSCGNCSVAADSMWLTDDSLFLRCNCLTSDGGYPYSTVDLNEFIFNSDGTMGCFVNLGNKTLAGPIPPPSPVPSI